jgi:hypothetical protein
VPIIWYSTIKTYARKNKPRAVNTRYKELIAGSEEPRYGIGNKQTMIEIQLEIF